MQKSIRLIGMTTFIVKLIKMQFPLSSCVFPIAVPPLRFAWGNPRRPQSGGQHDAIDFVPIAIPSLRSLRRSHNRGSSLIMPLRFVRRFATTWRSRLYDTSTLTLDLLAALRLEVTSSNLHKTCISTP